MNLNEILALADQYEAKLPAFSSHPESPKGLALAGWIDHTLLKPEATAAQIEKLCAEAREHQFATVCVNPAYVERSAKLLNQSGVGVCSVVGFPLGSTFPEIKAAETRRTIEAGASEIDTVINFGALRSGDFQLAFDDVAAVVEAARGKAHVK
ncbi:MAG TPA: deoxyribose-phosphate aldolase, partial [Pseudomonadales bacterium]|nr:deoxyribose-phosphate aldolase [Pseudomonadales bacterium]